MDGNYIKFYRKFLEWEWWDDINTSRLFIYMLLKANWKDGNFKGLDIPKGSFVSSIAKLSDGTKLTCDEVRTALKHLKSTDEITSKSHSKFTVFTIKNYCSYQQVTDQITEQFPSSSQASPEQVPSSSHSIPTLFPTIEEGKNIRREEEEEKKEGKKESRKEKTKEVVATQESATFPSGSFEMLCVDAMIQSCLGQFTGAKVPTTIAQKEDWCSHINKMLRLDKRSEAEIWDALQFAVNDKFWKTNILSTKKFREKFETLIIQARQKKSKPKPNNRFHNFEQSDTDYDSMVWDIVKQSGQKVTGV